MNVGIILAAGSGTRVGAGTPKQFIEVLGRPVLAYALQAYQRAPEIDAIQVVCRREWAAKVRDIARDAGVTKLRWVTEGGDSCPDSIRRAVFALRGDLSGDDQVAVHMAVSPLTTGEDIARALRVCREKGCCFTMHPVNVCLARGGGDGFADTDAPKERFVELNVPWAFNYGRLYDLYRRLDDSGRTLGVNDYTLGLWLAAGNRAWYVRGSDAGRLKITTAHDLELFEGYLLYRARHGGERP